MGRIGLALVLLMGWMSVARATPCTQPDLDAGISGGQLTYDPQLTFEDGSSVRVGQPVTPANVRLAIAADHQDNNEWIGIEGSFDRHAKYIGVEVGPYTMMTTPDRLYVCSRGTALYDHTYDARIFSIDRYGNRSDAVSKQVMTIGGQPERHYRCGLYAVGLMLGSLVIAGLLLVVLVIVGAIRKRGPRGAPYEIISSLLAENVARRVLRGYWIKLAIAVLTTLVLWTFDHPFLAFQLSPFAVVWLWEVGTAWHVVKQFETGIQALGKHDRWLCINGNKLYAPDRVWAKASSIPTAGLA